MLVEGVFEVRGRGLVVTVDAPTRGLQPGWCVGCGDRTWSVSAIEHSAGSGGRASRRTGLVLVPVKAEFPPEIGDVLEIRAASKTLK